MMAGLSSIPEKDLERELARQQREKQARPLVESTPQLPLFSPPKQTSRVDGAVHEVLGNFQDAQRSLNLDNEYGLYGVSTTPNTPVTLHPKGGAPTFTNKPSNKQRAPAVSRGPSSSTTTAAAVPASGTKPKSKDGKSSISPNGVRNVFNKFNQPGLTSKTAKDHDHQAIPDARSSSSSSRDKERSSKAELHGSHSKSSKGRSGDKKPSKPEDGPPHDVTSSSKDLPSSQAPSHSPARTTHARSATPKLEQASEPKGSSITPSSQKMPTPVKPISTGHGQHRARLSSERDRRKDESRDRSSTSSSDTMQSPKSKPAPATHPRHLFPSLPNGVPPNGALEPGVDKRDDTKKKLSRLQMPELTLPAVEPDIQSLLHEMIPDPQLTGIRTPRKDEPSFSFPTSTQGTASTKQTTKPGGDVKHRQRPPSKERPPTLSDSRPLTKPLVSSDSETEEAKPEEPKKVAASCNKVDDRVKSHHRPKDRTAGHTGSAKRECKMSKPRVREESDSSSSSSEASSSDDSASEEESSDDEAAAVVKQEPQKVKEAGGGGEEKPDGQTNEEKEGSWTLSTYFNNKKVETSNILLSPSTIHSSSQVSVEPQDEWDTMISDIIHNDTLEISPLHSDPDMSPCEKRLPTSVSLFQGDVPKKKKSKPENDKSRTDNTDSSAHGTKETASGQSKPKGKRGSKSTASTISPSRHPPKSHPDVQSSTSSLSSRKSITKAPEQHSQVHVVAKKPRKRTISECSDNSVAKRKDTGNSKKRKSQSNHVSHAAESGSQGKSHGRSNGARGGGSKTPTQVAKEHSQRSPGSSSGKRTPKRSKGPKSKPPISKPIITSSSSSSSDNDSEVDVVNTSSPEKGTPTRLPPTKPHPKTPTKSTAALPVPGQSSVVLPMEPPATAPQFSRNHTVLPCKQPPSSVISEEEDSDSDADSPSKDLRNLSLVEPPKALLSPLPSGRDPDVSSPRKHNPITNNVHLPCEAPPHPKPRVAGLTYTSQGKPSIMVHLKLALLCKTKTAQLLRKSPVTSLPALTTATTRSPLVKEEACECTVSVLSSPRVRTTAGSTIVANSLISGPPPALGLPSNTSHPFLPSMENESLEHAQARTMPSPSPSHPGQGAKRPNTLDIRDTPVGAGEGSVKVEPSTPTPTSSSALSSSGMPATSKLDKKHEADAVLSKMFNVSKDIKTTAKRIPKRPRKSGKPEDNKRVCNDRGRAHSAETNNIIPTKSEPAADWGAQSGTAAVEDDRLSTASSSASSQLSERDREREAYARQREHRDHDRQRDRDRERSERDKDRSRDRERERERDRRRDAEREKERSRDVEREKERSRPRDWDAPNAQNGLSDASSPRPPTLTNNSNHNSRSVAADWGSIATGNMDYVDPPPPTRVKIERYMEPIVCQIESNQDYLQEAKRLKHKAEQLSNRIHKSLMYMESVLSFLQCGHAMDQGNASHSDVYRMYKDTLNFCKHICSNRGRHDSHDNERKLHVLGCRLQSFLYLKLYLLDKDKTNNLKKAIDDHFKQVQSKGKAGVQAPSPYPPGGGSWPRTTGTPSPMSPQPSPVGSVGSVSSVGSGNGDIPKITMNGNHTNHLGTVLPPTGVAGLTSASNLQRISSMMERYINNMQYLGLCHDSWDRADQLVNDYKDFFRELDGDCGSLNMQSSVPEIVRYIKVGLHRLKDAT